MKICEITIKAGGFNNPRQIFEKNIVSAYFLNFLYFLFLNSFL
jgi:hypothetical protein